MTTIADAPTAATAQPSRQARPVRFEFHRELLDVYAAGHAPIDPALAVLATGSLAEKFQILRAVDGVDPVDALLADLRWAGIVTPPPGCPDAAITSTVSEDGFRQLVVTLADDAPGLAGPLTVAGDFAAGDAAGWPLVLSVAHTVVDEANRIIRSAAALAGLLAGQV